MNDFKSEIIKDYIKSQGYDTIIESGFTITGYKGDTRLSIDKLSDNKISISKTIISDYDELIRSIKLTVPLEITQAQGQGQGAK